MSNEFPTFSAIDGAVDLDFLRLWFLLPSTIAAVEAQSSGSTPLTRNRFKEGFFSDLTIPLPTIAEQRRVVARLSVIHTRIDEALRLRNEARALLEAMRHSILGAAFAHTTGPRTTNLEDVCEAIIDNLHSNPVYSDGGGVPCVRSPDVVSGRLKLDTALCTSEDEYERRTRRGKPMAGDIVFVREGGGAGKAGIVEDGQRFSLGQRVMMLRPDRTCVVPKFLLYYILSPLVQELQILPRILGSASPHINIAALRTFVVQLPPLDQQERIVAFVERCSQRLGQVCCMQGETEELLKAMTSSSLRAAFEGRL